MTNLQKTSNISIKVDSDDFGLEQSSLISTYLKDGISPISHVNIVTLSIEKLKSFCYDLLSSKGDKLTTVLNESTPEVRGIIFTKEEYLRVSLRELGGYTSVEFTGYLTFENREKLLIFIKNNIYAKPRVAGVYSVHIQHYYLDKLENLKKVDHVKNTESFKNIRDDLYPKVNVPLLMEMYSESNENNLILTGSPGTGKTCFVKKCLRELALNKKKDIRAVYVKDRELLKKDSFWAQLSAAKPDVLVLDDLDDELLPRTAGRNDIVNNMLSFSDGLFDINTKIIITTNQPNTAIDKALIRPGRCFDILSLPNLTWEEALSVWLSGFGEKQESFASIFGVDSSKVVSQAALISEYQRFSKKSEAPYLLDSSISIRTTVEGGGFAN